MTQLVTPSLAEPISLAEMKAHLRLPLQAPESPALASEDTQMQAWLQAAREQVEADHGRALLAQTVTEEWPCFWESLRLSASPFLSMLSLKYVDNDGATQTIAASDYQLDSLTDPARLYPKYGQHSLQKGGSQDTSWGFLSMASERGSQDASWGFLSMASERGSQDAS